MGQQLTNRAIIFKHTDWDLFMQSLLYFIYPIPPLQSYQ